MKPNELVDIVAPTAPQTDWLGWVMMLGEGLLALIILWIIWVLLPIFIRPLAFRYQLRQLNKRYEQMPIETVYAQFYQWFLMAQHCDVWQDASQKETLSQALNQACFSNTPPPQQEIKASLQAILAVFTYANIWRSIQRRGLKLGRFYGQILLQKTHEIWQSWSSK